MRARRSGRAAPNASIRSYLSGVANGPPIGVVAVLLAPAGVPAGGEDVAARIRADPDVGPGRRDRDRGDPAELSSLADQRAIGPVVREALPARRRRNAGPIVRHVAQSSSLGGRDGVERMVDDQGRGQATFLVAMRTAKGMAVAISSRPHGETRSFEDADRGTRLPRHRGVQLPADALPPTEGGATA